MTAKRQFTAILTVLVLGAPVLAGEVMIPMDASQSDHLKAYGVAFWALEQGARVDWLLNYRGGSFLCEEAPGLREACMVRGVLYESIDAAAAAAIRARIEQENMELIRLEVIGEKGSGARD